MTRPGRWISLLPIFALVPRLGLVVLAADREAVTPETKTALLWISSAALAALVGLAEVYVGSAVVSRRSRGLALLWVAITLSLNALIVPLSVSGLEAVPVWQILSSRALRVAWGAGIGLLSTLCVCGCLWADVLLKEAEAQVVSLQAEIERAASAAPSAPPPLPAHAACSLCGYWDADQRRVAGHIRQCRRRAAHSRSTLRASR
jgi:hypothetical protein